MDSSGLTMVTLGLVISFCVQRGHSTTPELLSQPGIVTSALTAINNARCNYTGPAGAIDTTTGCPDQQASSSATQGSADVPPPTPNPTQTPAVSPVPATAQIPAPAPLVAEPPMIAARPSNPQNLVLVAGGASSLTRSTSAIFQISTQSFTAGANLAATSGRQYHTMATISSTQILAAGGDFNLDPSAEFWDSANQTWTLTNPMREYRAQHSMALFANGTVFVAGGVSTDNAPKGSTELFQNGIWTAGPSLSEPRFSFEMLTLANGTVLACGGNTVASTGTGTRPTDSCELYSPATNTWSKAPSLLTAVSNHRAIRLLNGDVLVAGGRVQTGNSSTTQRLPTSPQAVWVQVGNLAAGRYGHDLALLLDGRVLACGGSSTSSGEGGGLATCEIFDPATNFWVSGPSLPSGQLTPRLQTLADGRVLFVGTAAPSVPNSAVWSPGDTAFTILVNSSAVPGRTVFGIAGL